MERQKALKHSKKVWAVKSCALSAIILSALVSPAHAGASKTAAAPKAAADAKQLMKYDVYAGGFHVVSSDLIVDFAKKTDYLLRLGANTHGFLGDVAPWTGVFQTQGWYDAKKDFPQPHIHFSDTTFREDKELTEFFYNKDGSFKEYRVTNNEKGKEKEPPPTDDLTQGTTDVLTATLKVMEHIAAGGKCEGSDDIFDGKRRYKIIFGNSQQVDIAPSDLNVYVGPATECTIEVKPVAGKWHEKPRGWMSIQEQGRERGKMPTIWFAQMAPGEPAVPVKIRVKTEYGTLFMHLTHYSGQGKTLSLPEED